ncbi:MAG TPA: nucleotide exchange factor GrpE [Candidatus Paceibacterota bacterium]|nr:nucleotide exchange factor GrpE [Candidatus Paceibacterota bacterium]
MSDDVHIDPEMNEDNGRSESEIAEEETRADSKVKKLREELEQCRIEKTEYLDGWQRAKADYVNVLKRGEAEQKSAKLMGRIDAVEALLPAFDALERSKEHGEIPAGFQAIAKQLESALASLGVTAIGQMGEKFDPSLHEALGQDATDSEDKDDHITAVLERGWKIGPSTSLGTGDIIIRPAKVRVAHFTK